MSEQKLPFDLSSLIKENKIFISLLSIGLLLLFGGLILGRTQKQSPKSSLEFISKTESSAESTSPQNPKTIFVDISGAVNKPGVWEISFGSRVGELIIKAGGLADNADLAWIEKNLNQAAKVTDGMKIYIPREGEKALTVAGVNTGVLNTSGGSEQSGLININTAGASELDSLWGIGAKRAEAIISGRPYTDINELLTRGIVPKNVFDAMKDKIGI